MKKQILEKFDVIIFFKPLKSNIYFFQRQKKEKKNNGIYPKKQHNIK